MPTTRAQSIVYPRPSKYAALALAVGFGSLDQLSEGLVHSDRSSGGGLIRPVSAPQHGLGYRVPCPMLHSTASLSCAPLCPIAPRLLSSFMHLSLSGEEHWRSVSQVEAIMDVSAWLQKLAQQDEE